MLQGIHSSFIVANKNLITITYAGENKSINNTFTLLRWLLQHSFDQYFLADKNKNKQYFGILVKWLIITKSQALILIGSCILCTKQTYVSSNVLL